MYGPFPVPSGRTISSTVGSGPQSEPEMEPIQEFGSRARQAAMPSGGWASRSSTATLPSNPSARTAAMATAMSFTGQLPPADVGPAWWKPPRRFSWGLLRRSASPAACTVAPVARRTVFITSSTGTSVGSTPKTPPSVSGRASDSSSAGSWTRESSA